MTWNESGFLVASTNENACDSDSGCIKVCPFNPEPDPNLANENLLASKFLPSSNSQSQRIGHYNELFAGFSTKYRATSSSGGIATFVVDKLLKQNEVQHVISVGPVEQDSIHYEYKIVSNVGELLATSKTRYHPVTLSETLNIIKQLPGKVAISGVACFLKGVRLAQAHDPVLAEKVHFLVGIICGGVKSRFFTEYLASKAGADPNGFDTPEYRVKDERSSATDYSFSCDDRKTRTLKQIKMREVGDMWGTGLFKANACDYCDDVTTELADISLGDAWIEPYRSEGQGTNIVITRSALASDIISRGIATGELVLDEISVQQVISSQQGSFNHRQDAIGIRMANAASNGVKIAPKRHGLDKLPFHRKIVQRLRRHTRARSLEVWKRTKNSEQFDRSMHSSLLSLRLVTRAAQLLNTLKGLLRG